MGVFAVVCGIAVLIYLVVNIANSNPNTHQWRGDEHTKHMLEYSGMLHNPERKTSLLVYIMIIGWALFFILFLIAKK